MGKILIPGGGGGTDLDVITATAPDVRKNKVIIDKDGEPLAGAMNEQAGGTFTPGTSDRVLVPANTFVTSAIVMKGDPNLIAGNIKKNVPIFGVIGSHDGYVVSANHLYKYGSNVAGFYRDSGTVTFESNSIYVQQGGARMNSTKVYNLTGYTYLKVHMNVTAGGTGQHMLSIYRHSTSRMIKYQDGLGNGNQTITFNISDIYYSDAIDVIYTGIWGQVYQIWLE